MLFSNYRIVFILGFAVSLLGGCSRMQVVPEGDAGLPPAETATVITTPIDSAPLTGPMEVQTHVVQPKESLYGIARLYGLDYKMIAAWNNIAPPYTIHPGQSLRLAATGGGMVAMPIPMTPITEAPRYYTVRAGDTVASIARAYNVTPQELIAWNELAKPYTLTPGQSLMVKPAPMTGGAISAPAPAVVATSGETIIIDGRAVPLIPAGEWNPSAPVSVPSVPADTGGTFHTVKSGETMYSIALQYNLTLQELAAWNGMAQPYPPLQIGQQLRVSRPGGGAGMNFVPSADAGGASHVVKKGETLYRIAKQHNVTVDALAAANGIKTASTLAAGQRLTIPGAASSSKKRTVSTSAVSQPPRAAATPVAAVSAPRNAPAKIYHTVGKGESLANIAAMYGQTTQDVAQWNGIAPPYNVYVGQSLIVVQ